MGDLAQLGDGSCQLRDGGVEQAVHIEGGIVEMSLSQSQRHPEGNQPLLGAVVQVPFEAAALLVRGVQ